jgi:hypothetical protein
MLETPFPAEQSPDTRKAEESAPVLAAATGDAPLPESASTGSSSASVLPAPGKRPARKKPKAKTEEVALPERVIAEESQPSEAAPAKKRASRPRSRKAADLPEASEAVTATIVE